jgi:hypothetical protein
LIRFVVFGLTKHKPRERFYLLPGQGGRSYHQKQRRFLRWAIAVAVFTGTLVAITLWWLSRPQP